MTLREKMKELKLKNIKVKINKSACISWNNRDREESYGPRVSKSWTVQKNTRDIVRLLRIKWNSYFPLSSELKIVRRLVRLQLYKTIVGNLLKRMVLLTVGFILTVLSLMNTYYSEFTNQKEKSQSFRFWKCEIDDHDINIKHAQALTLDWWNTIHGSLNF